LEVLEDAGRFFWGMRMKLRILALRSSLVRGVFLPCTLVLGQAIWISCSLQGADHEFFCSMLAT
jgi:hypothetical protein